MIQLELCWGVTSTEQGATILALKVQYSIVLYSKLHCLGYGATFHCLTKTDKDTITGPLRVDILLISEVVRMSVPSLTTEDMQHTKLA